MSSELIRECFEVDSEDVHSDAGSGNSIECPNCRQKVVFARSQWWDSTCECGEWDLIQKAELHIGED